MKIFKNISKLKSTTLVEVLIASVISAISFALGLMIYTNILHSNRSQQKSNINLFIKQDLYQSIQKDEYKSKNIEYNSIEIEKSIQFFENKNDLVLLNYKAINTKGNIIIENNYLQYIGN